MDSDNKRVIVTGGGGFIGKALCRELSQAGYQPVALSRGASHAGSPVFAPWDGVSAAGWGHLCEGAYAVVNLAGENIAGARWNQQRKRSILESRVQAGRAVCEALEGVAVRPKVLVQASAVGFYGDTGQGTADEDTPSGSGFLAEVCRQWEDSTECAETLGMRRVVIRTGLVLGRRGGLLERMLPPFRLFLGGPLGHGAQGFPWIHLEDEVRAIMFLLEHPEASGAFNLAAPQPVSNLEFSRALAAALSRPSALAAPGWALRLVFGREMADELFLTGCRALPARLTALGFTFKYPRLHDALAELLS